MTVDVSHVTMLPPESTTSTMGCGVSATPLMAPGRGVAVAKASFAAAPTVTVIGLDAFVRR